jgi:hypothetical protein
MTYPRKYAVATAAGDHLKDLDWDPMVDAANGMTIAGGVTIQYPYSFIVRNIGGVYDAISGNGVLTYGGSSDAGGIDGGDASAVAQECIDAMTTAGLLHFRRGIYDLGNTPITIPNTHGFILSGEGHDINGTNGTWLSYTGNNGAIQVVSAGRNQCIRLHNFGVKATGAAQASATAYGIYALNCEDFLIQDVGVRDFIVGRGIYIQGGTGGVSYSPLVYLRHLFGYNNKIGVSLEGGDATHEVNSGEISHCMMIGVGKTVANSIGYHLGNYVTDVSVHRCNAESSYYAMYIEANYSHIHRFHNEDVNTAYLLTATSGANIISEPVYGGETTKYSDSGTENLQFSHGGNNVTTWTQTVLSAEFSVETATQLNIDIQHLCPFQPTVDECSLQIVPGAVSAADWGYDLLAVWSTDSSWVSTKIKISDASGVAGATAKIALKVNRQVFT